MPVHDMNLPDMSKTIEHLSVLQMDIDINRLHSNTHPTIMGLRQTRSRRSDLLLGFSANQRTNHERAGNRRRDGQAKMSLGKQNLQYHLDRA